MSRAVFDWMDERGIPQAVIIGHSLGGKVAMSMGLSEGGELPSRVAGLVVLDISPVRYPPSGSVQTQLRSVIDVCLRMPVGPGVRHIRELNDYLTAEGVGDGGVRQFVLTNVDKSTFEWRTNIQGLWEALDDLCDFPFGGERYEGDVLFIAGGDSEYVKLRHQPDMEKFFGAHMISTIREAGHWGEFFWSLLAGQKNELR